MLTALGLGLAAIALTQLAAYTRIELARFEHAQARRVTTIYAAGQPLASGVSVRGLDLAGTLARLRYREVGTLTGPGQFRRQDDAWEVWTRGDHGGAQRQPVRLRLELDDGRISRILNNDEPAAAAALEPEVLTSVADRRGEQYRPVRLGEVPLGLLHAVLAAEDHRFFEHPGVDLRAVVRAGWANVKAGRIIQGGSTITQQLVKNRLLGAQRTLGRKLREAWLAAVVEFRYTKTQILEAYLNEVYLGHLRGRAVRGVGAAARVYFGKEIHQLTLGEAAVLAGMMRAPNSYSPVLSPERARQRRDVVLPRMHELGRLSDGDYQATRREPIRVRPIVGRGQGAPYFSDLVRQETEHRLGADVAQGARVYTTLDPALQRFAEASVTRGLKRLERRFPRLRRARPIDRLQAALIALDPATGDIRALVGGRSYEVSQFNRALLARRQPGSAFKPVVFTAALRRSQGGPAFTAASFVDDSPITLAVNGKAWSPRNYEDRYEGRVTVRQALERSLNAATVRIAQEAGLARVISTARTLGIAGVLWPVPAVALGAFEVRPVELARAYLPFANGGVRLDSLKAVRAVREFDGTPVALDEPRAVQVLSPAEAYLMTSLMEGVMARGTGAAARALGVSGPVAGKTGTTNDGRDAWFVGYARNLLALTWVGFDNGEPHGLSGTQAALPIWADFMRQALDAYPAPPFEAPAGVAVLDIDMSTGKPATAFCPLVARETFLTGTEPTPCDEHRWTDEFQWWHLLRQWRR
jgi:penicillin-binding protein 1B